jgi:hypothetical protein
VEGRSEYLSSRVLKNPGDVILIPPWREKNLGIYGIKQIQRSFVACGSSG